MIQQFIGVGDLMMAAGAYLLLIDTSAFAGIMSIGVGYFFKANAGGHH